jgi:hypothetical protein
LRQSHLVLSKNQLNLADGDIQMGAEDHFDYYYQT